MEAAYAIERCIALCLDKGVDFALCLMPGDDCPHIFIPSLPDSCRAGTATFEIGPWLSPYAERIVVNGETDLRTALQFLGKTPVISVCDKTGAWFPVHSTIRESYIEEVSRVIDSCRNRGGKTVFSRVICGETSIKNWGRLFITLCDTFHETFRFIFHTSRTGGWIGATPETLLDVDMTDGSFHTMAFAGTRPTTSDPTPWDEKNIRENWYVSDYLIEKIAQFGIKANVGDFITVAYGNKIEHLCRHIYGTLRPGMDFQPLLDAINPTPALCGTPLADAVADLARHEHHQRGCYGGFVALHDGHRFSSFVTLRCCTFAGRRFAIYSGGGITPDSIPEVEWGETEAKSLFFRRYLQKNM